MDATVRTIGNTRLLILPASGDLLASPGDTNDFLSEAWSHEADMVAVPVERLAPDFFVLSTRLAGEVTQKFVTYGVRLAIVGDVEKAAAASTALRDYIRESNRGLAVWFVPDLAALEARLASSFIPRD